MGAVADRYFNGHGKKFSGCGKSEQLNLKASRQNYKCRF
jgi:hypothetical protein